MTATTASLVFLLGSINAQTLRLDASGAFFTERGDHRETGVAATTTVDQTRPDRQTETDRQTDRHTDRGTYRHTGIQPYIPTDIQT